MRKDPTPELNMYDLTITEVLVAGEWVKLRPGSMQDVKMYIDKSEAFNPIPGYRFQSADGDWYFTPGFSGGFKFEDPTSSIETFLEAS